MEEKNSHSYRISSDNMEIAIYDRRGYHDIFGEVSKDTLYSFRSKISGNIIPFVSVDQLIHHDSGDIFQKAVRNNLSSLISKHKKGAAITDEDIYSALPNAAIFPKNPKDVAEALSDYKPELKDTGLAATLTIANNFGPPAQLHAFSSMSSFNATASGIDPTLPLPDRNNESIHKIVNILRDNLQVIQANELVSEEEKQADIDRTLQIIDAYSHAEDGTYRSMDHLDSVSHYDAAALLASYQPKKRDLLQDLVRNMATVHEGALGYIEDHTIDVLDLFQSPENPFEAGTDEDPSGPIKGLIDLCYEGQESGKYLKRMTQEDYQNISELPFVLHPIGTALNTLSQANSEAKRASMTSILESMNWQIPEKQKGESREPLINVDDLLHNTGQNPRALLKNRIAALGHRPDQADNIRFSKKDTLLFMKNLSAVNTLTAPPLIAGNNPKSTFYTSAGESIAIEPNESKVSFFDKSGEKVFEHAAAPSNLKPIIALFKSTPVGQLLPEGQIKSMSGLLRTAAAMENNALLRETTLNGLAAHLSDEKDSQGRKVPLDKPFGWIKQYAANENAKQGDILAVVFDHEVDDSKRIANVVASSAIAAVAVQAGLDVRSTSDKHQLISAIKKNEELSQVYIDGVAPVNAASPSGQLNTDKNSISFVDELKKSREVHKVDNALNSWYKLKPDEALDISIAHNSKPSTEEMVIGTLGDGQDQRRVIASPIYSSSLIQEESLDMKHCISTYTGRIMAGEYYAWSIQMEEPDGSKKRLSTLGMNYRDDQLSFDQHYGYENEVPPKELSELVESLAGKLESDKGEIFTPTSLEGSEVNPYGALRVIIPKDIHDERFAAKAIHSLETVYGEDVTQSLLESRIDSYGDHHLREKLHEALQDMRQEIALIR